MVESDIIRGHAETWIKGLLMADVFHLSRLYEYIRKNFRAECDNRGLVEGRSEPWYKHDARQGVRNCKADGLIVPIGKPHSGNYERT